jgi:hypothetical protein
LTFANGVNNVRVVWVAGDCTGNQWQQGNHSKHNKPGKVYSVPEYTEFSSALFAMRILKKQIRLAPRNRFVKNTNSFK